MSIPESAPPARRLWPADYYAAPASPAVLPAWVSWGCGALSLLVLIVVFAGGAWMSSGGIVDFMDFALGMSVGEIRYADDVTPAAQKSLQSDIDAMRENLREKRISVAALRPFLDGLRRATADRKVTAEEASSLHATVRSINARATR